MSIDFSADAGESFGRWILGDDDELMKHVTSVNVACGFHGGDPSWMRNSVELAKRYGVDLGAHPGFLDFLGFGWQNLAVSAEEVIDMCVYQVGALMAFAKSAGVHLTHVKPHGSLNMMMNQNADLLAKFADAMLALQSDLDIVALAGPSAEMLRDRGVSVRVEVVADMEYDDNGVCINERTPLWKDPQHVAARAIELASGVLKTVGGNEFEIQADSLCIHGNRPNAVEVAFAVRAGLSSAGLEVVAPPLQSNPTKNARR